MTKRTLILAILVNTGCGADASSVATTDGSTSDASSTTSTTSTTGEAPTSGGPGSTGSESSTSSGETDTSDTGAAPETALLRGGVEKGPLLQGSTIEAARLRKDGAPTGEVWPGQLLTDAGEFDLGKVPVGAYALVANGYAFDEIRGLLGAAPITMRAYVSAPTDGDVFVNVVTHLGNRRVLASLVGGAKIEPAVKDAQAELVATLPIGVPGLQVASAGTTMSVLGGDDAANRYLFAASALVGQAAVIAAKEMGDTVEAQLQQWLDQIASDLADDGVLAPAMREQLEVALLAIDAPAVEANLGARMAELGLPVVVPDLDLVLDQDRDGLVNADDNCDKVPNPTQDDADADGLGDPCDPGEPELLVDKLELPWSFSRQGDWIYFTTMGKADLDDGGMWRVPVDGGLPELLSMTKEPRWLTTSPAGVFWTAGLPLRADLDGNNEVVVAQVLARPLAVDATHLYFANNNNVQRVPLAGGPAQVIAMGFDASYELTLDAMRVYWSSADTVESVAKDGTGRLTLAIGQGYASGLASDGVHLFWLDHNACAIRRVPVGGGPEQTLWQNDPKDLGVCVGGTTEIALDDKYVYWGGNSVQRLAKTGGARELIADGDAVRVVRDIEVDDTHVYWLNHAGYCNIDKTCDTGSLWRILKPL